MYCIETECDDDTEVLIVNVEDGKSRNLSAGESAKNFRWLPYTHDIVWQEVSEHGLELWISSAVDEYSKWVEPSCRPRCC